MRLRQTPRQASCWGGRESDSSTYVCSIRPSPLSSYLIPDLSPNYESCRAVIGISALIEYACLLLTLCSSQPATSAFRRSPATRLMPTSGGEAYFALPMEFRLLRGLRAFPRRLLEARFPPKAVHQGGTRTRRERGLGSQGALNPSASLCRGTSRNSVFRSTGMVDSKDSTQYFRRCARRQYLTEYERERRRQAKAEGS
jgi:hypothetical protein